MQIKLIFHTEMFIGYDKIILKLYAILKFKDLKSGI